MLKLPQVIACLFIQAFCAMPIHAQKASLFSHQANSYSVQTEKDSTAYLQSKPQIPYRYTTDSGGDCAFDGFGVLGKPEFLCTCNNLDAAKTLNTDKLWLGGGLGLNLSGNGMNKLGVWDGGAARISHREFGSRITIMDGAAVSAHTTAVAGNMIAAGVNANAKGMSYQTQLKNWNFTNDNAEIIVAGPSLFLSNHSYASTTAWNFISGSWYWYGDSAIHQFKDWKYGYYDNRSRIWDSMMYFNPYYLMVKAAGNDRGSFVPPGTTHYYWNGTAWALTNTTRDTVGPYDCISTFGTAKNLLCVGAVQVMPLGFGGPSSVSMLSFSSWGPTDDGRIKPDLVAASGSILSAGTAHDSDYAFLGGTSMSAPNVAGSLLLLQEYFFQLKGRYMRNATLKGLAIHTANRCKALPGPDYECGWGIPDMRRAALCLSDSFKNTVIEQQLLPNDSFSVDVYATAGDSLRVTLCWTDPKSFTGVPAYNDTTRKLVNDLDIRLQNMAGNTMAFPFILNPAIPAAAATSGDNIRDNVEQILMPAMPAGRYRIKVKHKGVLQGNIAQSFSLLISGSPLYTPVLPVKWLSLKGAQQNWNEVRLDWVLAAEINNKAFVVEFSTDGQHFSEVGKVTDVAGNSQQTTQYAFIHTQLKGFSGTVFYRIKQVDLDGTISYSNTIDVSTHSDWQVLSVYPNPFNSQVQVNMLLPQQSSNVVRVFSMLGELRYEQNLQASGAYELNIPLQHLAAGMYLLEVQEQSAQQRKYIQKIVKN